MNQSSMLPLSPWQNFYVILGSAAGGLTGLQFVVLTLVAQMRTASTIGDIRAFGTPTVVHFCSALLISALMAAPWPSLGNLAICLGAGGVLGIIYSIAVVWHARHAVYNPDLEEWIWYIVLPLLAHLTLATAAVLLWWNSAWALPTVAGDTLAFLIIGIHNAWDTVTYVALSHTRGQGTPEQTQGGVQPD